LHGVPHEKSIDFIESLFPFPCASKSTGQVVHCPRFRWYQIVKSLKGWNRSGEESSMKQGVSIRAYGFRIRSSGSKGFLKFEEMIRGPGRKLHPVRIDAQKDCSGYLNQLRIGHRKPVETRFVCRVYWFSVN